MYKAVLTLLAGLMLLTAISIGDSWAADQIKAPNCTAVEKQILKAEAARLERCGSTAPKDCFDYVISENASYFIKYKADEPTYYFGSVMDDDSHLSMSFEPRQYKYVMKLEEFEPAGQAIIDNCGLVKQYDGALDVDVPWPDLFKPSIEGSLYLHGWALWRNNSDISLDIALLDAKNHLADSISRGKFENTIESVDSNSLLSTATLKNELVEPVDTNLIVTDINQFFFPRSRIYSTQLLIEYVPGATRLELLKRLNNRRLCEITYDEKKVSLSKALASPFMSQKPSAAV